MITFYLTIRQIIVCPITGFMLRRKVNGTIIETDDSAKKYVKVISACFVCAYFWMNRFCADPAIGVLDIWLRVSCCVSAHAFMAGIFVTKLYDEENIVYVTALWIVILEMVNEGGIHDEKSYETNSLHAGVSSYD